MRSAGRDPGILGIYLYQFLCCFVWCRSVLPHFIPNAETATLSWSFTKAPCSRSFSAKNFDHLKVISVKRWELQLDFIFQVYQQHKSHCHIPNPGTPSPSAHFPECWAGRTHWQQQAEGDRGVLHPRGQQKEQNRCSESRWRTRI